jgi:hypothetical protein
MMREINKLLNLLLMDIDSYIDIDREEYLKDDESEKNQKKY